MKAYDSGTRTLRHRQEAIESYVDRSRPASPSGTARRMVQIFNNGSMPTSNDKFFAAHPVQYDGPETEGGIFSPVADTSTVMFVDVIGSTVPSVGDRLVATLVGGRWVAERGNGAPQNECCLTTCKPCSIPQKDLQLAYTNLITGNGTTTLHYSGGSWMSDCVNGVMFTLGCNGGQVELRVIYFTTGSCPTGTQQACSSLGAAPAKLTLSSSQCQPLSLTFTSQSAGCPAVTGAGFTQFVVSDPNPPPPNTPLMCQSFVINCCNEQISGATVSLYQSEGGTLLATGTTPNIYFAWPGSPGTYWLTITPNDSLGLFQSFAGPVVLACNGTTRINLIPISGYTCICGFCCEPIPFTLDFSDSLLGVAGTVTYQTSGPYAETWTYSQSVSYPASTACGAGSVDVTWSFACDADIWSVVMYFGATDVCPGGPVQAFTSIPQAFQIGCPPTFNVTWGYTPAVTDNALRVLYGQWNCGPGGSPCVSTTIMLSQ
jgi:hypothetical protein